MIDETISEEEADTLKKWLREFLERSKDWQIDEFTKQMLDDAKKTGPQFCAHVKEFSENFFEQNPAIEEECRDFLENLDSKKEND